MKLLKDICEVKMPINLRAAIWSACPLGNASIIPYKNNGKYLCAFRQFPYFLNPHNSKMKYKFFTSPAPRTKNESWFALLDNNFFPEGRFLKVVPEYPANQEELVSWVHEDLRLFRWGDEVWFSGTTFKRPRRTKYASVIGKVRDSNWEIALDVQFQSMQDKFKENTHQKNWMAVPHMPGKLIYEIDDASTKVIDIFNSASTSELENPSSLTASFGNTPLFQIDDSRHIAIVHLPHRMGTLEYTSRFIVFDNDLHAVKVSSEFRFDDVCAVEMAMSIFQQNDRPSMLGVTVCENDTFQYVYLVDKCRLLDFIFS